MFRALPKDSGASMVELFDFFSTSVVMCLQRTQFLSRTPSPIRFLREVMPKAESGYPVVVVKHGNNICFIHRRIRNLDSHFKEFPSATLKTLECNIETLENKKQTEFWRLQKYGERKHQLEDHPTNQDWLVTIEYIYIYIFNSYIYIYSI
jgi:hypothetical protein